MINSSSVELLAELERAGRVESSHFGIAVLIDPAGKVLQSAGDVSVPIFPRSALKPIQALVTQRLGLNLPPAETAITMASHYGTDTQVELVRSILRSADLTEQALGCPSDLPWNPQARVGKEKSAVYMNCSGKHAGFLACCKQNNWDLDSYLQPDHPLQVAIKRAIEELAGEKIAQTTIDGCGAPLFALSTLGLAKAFSGFVQQAPELVQIARSNPQLIGDVSTPDAVFLRAGLFSKLGAEGVFCVATDDGHTVALKIADGSLRAAPAVCISMLKKNGLISLSASDAVASATTVYATGGGQHLGQLVSKI